MIFCCCSLLSLLLSFCSVVVVMVVLPRRAIDTLFPSDMAVAVGTALDLLLSTVVLDLLFLLDSGIFEVEEGCCCCWCSLL